MKQIKKLPDSELQNKNEDFVRLSVDDKDDVDFNFEEDIAKIIKRISVKQLINNNLKYLKNFKKAMIAFYMQSYLVDNIKVGNKKVKRFLRLYGEAA